MNRNCFQVRSTMYLYRKVTHDEQELLPGEVYNVPVQEGCTWWTGTVPRWGLQCTCTGRLHMMNRNCSQVRSTMYLYRKVAHDEQELFPGEVVVLLLVLLCPKMRWSKQNIQSFKELFLHVKKSFGALKSFSLEHSRSCEL